MKKLQLFLILCLMTVFAGCKISGVITNNGEGIEGVTVTLNGDIFLETTTDGDGNYIFDDKNITTGNYTITPSKAGYTFSPENRDVYVGYMDVNHIDFTADEYFVLNEIFSLGHQQTKYNSEENIAITFERVVSDSRCPMDVDCVWQGNAEIEVAFIHNDASSTVTLNTSLSPTEISLSGYHIELIDLEPPASLSNPPEPDDYAVHLIITRSEGTCENNTDCDGDNTYCKKQPGDCDGKGTCMPRPEMYMTIYDPVCGCDGQTYPSMLDAASNGVNVDYRGECRDTSCDDDTEALCKMIPPECSQYEVLAIQNNCWVCVNPVTCLPWGEPGCLVDADVSCPDGYECNPCGTSSCPFCEDCVPACTEK